ncbi:MAG: extracellular solute-binding protein, partial [Turicibacter sp.]|nr:extracellular solute-binding protein [Turicibacter sp.]
LANSWDIALIPGVENEEGEILRYSNGGAENLMIFESSDKQEEAWEYLKWWTSTETQIEFGLRLQVTYGDEYLWNTANQEAYAQLPWDSDHKETILAQTQWLIEAPRVPGTYMLERELSNAYISIVLDGENERKAIDLAVKRINRETLRKLEEFGFVKNGEVVSPYVTPTLDLDVLKGGIE